MRTFVRPEKEVLFAFVATRLLVCAVGWFAYETVPHSTEHGIAGAWPWQFLFRWDAVHYYGIATSGYSNEGPTPTTPFFPLLPLCLHVLAFVTRGDLVVVGFVFSNMLLLGGAILLRRLLAIDFPPPSRVPVRSVWLLLVTPMTFFFSAVYTESLFFLLLVGALFLARQRRWFWCGVVGAFATATRPNGTLLLLPLLIEAIASRRQPPNTRLEARFSQSPFWLALAPLGFVAHAAYLHVRFGDALAFWHAQLTFSREGLLPWSAFVTTFDYPPPDAALFIATAVLATALCGVAVRKLRASYSVFACAMTLLCLSSTWYALPRYLSVIFPFYAALSVITERSESAFLATLVTSAAVMAACLALFVTGYPII